MFPRDDPVPDGSLRYTIRVDNNADQVKKNRAAKSDLN